MATYEDQTAYEYKYKRRLRNFLLQPLLQVRLGLYSIGLSIVFGAVVCAMLYFNFHRFYDMVLELTDLREEVTRILSGYVADASWWVVTAVAVYILVNIAVSIGYTHKLVGPTYAFRRHIENLRNGEYASRVILRRHDAFREVAEELNKLAEMLEERERRRSQEEERAS